MELFVVIPTFTRAHFGIDGNVPLCGLVSPNPNQPFVLYKNGGKFIHRYWIENGKLIEKGINNPDEILCEIENGTFIQTYESFYCSKCMKVIEKMLRESLEKGI